METGDAEVVISSIDSNNDGWATVRGLQLVVMLEPGLELGLDSLFGRLYLELFPKP